jgi:spermidine synthase
LNQNLLIAATDSSRVFAGEDSMPGEQTHKRFLPWLLLLFFGSGCAALIYEIVWLQLLELVIGSSGVSLAVLLGAFMGGMCLGSLMLPRLISCSRHPLRVYALLELAIGVFGILILYGVPPLSELYGILPGHGIFARALIASLCLLPPALLMGATLPAVARFVESTPEGVSWMGFFYGGNIAGAVVGCLSAGFFLLRLFDMPTATYVAVAINFLVSAAAYVLSKRSPFLRTADEATPGARPESPYRGLVYLTIGLSGLSALGAEVVWTRLLSLLLGGTVYSFSIILAVFLAALGIGSSIGSLLARTASRPRLWLGLCQMALTGTIAWAAFSISKSLPYWPINPSMYTSDLEPWFIFQLDILRTAWMVFPSAILWGASFPLAIAAVAVQGRDSGRMVGTIYAANTIGSILGSLAFSLLIIPQLGTQWAERLLIVVACVSAIMALASSVLKMPRRKENAFIYKFSFPGIFCTTIAVIVVALLINTVPRIPWMMVAWGRFCANYIAQAEPEIVSEKQPARSNASPSQWYCTYVGEGMNVSVAVTKTAAGVRFFHGAGKVQASSQPQDMRLQRMLGHLSVLTCGHPDQVSDVLVVACGAGVTAGSFVTYPNVKRIVICDIEPLVPKIVTPMFGPENYHIVDGIDKQNPHRVNGKEVTVIYDDGRHYIHTLPKDAKFDVITSDPIDPWVKGSAALNTVEYYEMCKRHLKSGGVMSLWMPLYESTNASAKSLIATFFQVFPNGMIFSNDRYSEGYDAVLLGQAEPSKVDLDGMQRMLDGNDYANVTNSLADVGFSTTEGMQPMSDRDVALHLFATFAGQSSNLTEWTKNAQINTDRNLRLQYLAGMHFNSFVSTKILQNILTYYRFPDNVFTGSSERIERLKEEMGYLGRRER